MSDFIAIISNVKIIKRERDTISELDKGVQVDKITDIFPCIDVFIKSGIANIYADVPGMEPEDISVYVYGDIVVIEGRKVPASSLRNYTYIRLERRFPSFKRTFRLPFEPERYEAVLTDGVLHIALAKGQD